jgi:hypothetical protein
MNPIIEFFEYEHLPRHLQDISRPLQRIAATMERDLVPSAETQAGLRKLLEAKDCFVRAALAGAKPHHSPVDRSFGINQVDIARNVYAESKVEA